MSNLKQGKDDIYQLVSYFSFFLVSGVQLTRTSLILSLLPWYTAAMSESENLLQVSSFESPFQVSYVG